MISARDDMVALALTSGLTEPEYDVIVQRLNRPPNALELGVFSVMWSEHCSYKSSRKHLSRLPTKGPRVIQGPGENAGVVDIGDGQAIVFKMESHNHPSFIEPYQGAATGVGGIMRDVFTMGARPIALLNALRFGDPHHPLTRRLVAGVVSGIGGYGNCVGVPTVGGETNFDAGYNGNILVNAMCVGLADADKIFYSAAPSAGLPVVYFGSKTGRDGIHGATMASASFEAGDEEKRPTVQVGDPFAEKLLIEATLELMATGAVAAIQDMGAAGLTSSSVEMAGKGGVGIDLDLDKVPQRETGHDRLRDDAVRKPRAHAGDPQARSRGRGARGLREVGPGRRDDRPNHRHRPNRSAARRARWCATSPSRRSPTTRRSLRPAVGPAAAPACAYPPRHTGAGRLASGCV